MPATIVGGSLTAREDAISRIYNIAFTMGPYQQADVSKGLHERVWRVRQEYDVDLQTGNVFIARTNEERTAFDPDSLIFSYSGSVLNELDLAFEQSGNPVICGDRLTGVGGLSEVWLYWFDTRIGNYVFTMLSQGRTPRVILDTPDDSSISDLLLFYLNDSVQRVEYRTQRDFYTNIETIPVNVWFDYETGAAILQTNTENFFLEEVARATSNRLHVIASTRNIETGRYQLVVAETAPYPTYYDERVSVSGLVIDALTLVTVIAVIVQDGVSLTAQLISADLLEIYIYVGPDIVSGKDARNDSEGVSIGGMIISITAQSLIITVNTSPESLNIVGTVQSANNPVTVLVTAIQRDNNSVSISGSIQSANLV